MSRTVDLGGYARAVAEERLRRRRGLLARLSPAERLAVEDVAYAVARRVADSLSAVPQSPAGMSKKNVEPSPSVEATQMRPPIRRTSSRQM